MKFASHVVGLAIACIAVPALAKPAYVASTVNLRAAPGTGSEIVAKIPGGSLVDAGGCDEGWCEISWQDKKGFAIQSSLDMSGRVPQQRAAAAAGPNYRQGPQGPQGPRGPRVVAGPDVVDGPVYYDAPPPPPVVYYGGPYYRPYWGWRRSWW
jgi:Bacterial SH3 domain